MVVDQKTPSSKVGYFNTSTTAGAATSSGSSLYERFKAVDPFISTDFPRRLLIAVDTKLAIDQASLHNGMREIMSATPK